MRHILPPQKENTVEGVTKVKTEGAVNVKHRHLKLSKFRSLPHFF